MLDPLLKPNLQTVQDQAHFLYDTSKSNGNKSKSYSFDSDFSAYSQVDSSALAESKSKPTSKKYHSRIQMPPARYNQNHNHRRSSHHTITPQQSSYIRSLKYFNRCAHCVLISCILIAVGIGISGILNVNFGESRRPHKVIPNPPPDAQGTMVHTTSCVLGTGWNLTTGCTVCQPNWKNTNGLCNDCADNHYGPNCTPCKCAVYDHSFEAANADRFLDCDEGVNGDGTCSIISQVNVFFVVVSTVLFFLVLVHLLLMCEGAASKCTRLTSSCPLVLAICMNATAGSVGKLPPRFRKFFVLSTMLLSFSSFSLLYAVVGQSLSLSPRWMLIWITSVFFINISNFSLLSLLVFQIGGELYAKQKIETKQKKYKAKFLDQRDDVKRLQEGWLISDDTISFQGNVPLGTGASAQVWPAVWEPLADAGATVAVKVLNRSGDLNELNKEIELMQRLSHSRLVHFFGAGTISMESAYGSTGTLFLVTELLYGGDLGSYLMDVMGGEERKIVVNVEGEAKKKNESARTDIEWLWLDRLQICLDIAKGMEYLHSHDVAHRDLKPGNVLLDRANKRAKVADFGLSKLLYKNKRSSNKSSNAMHQEFATKEEESGLKGTGPFMAPELWQASSRKKKQKGGVNVDAVPIISFKVDVYALAITMWQIMEAPALPYVKQGWNPSFTYQLAAMVGEQGLRPLLSGSDAVPGGFVELVEECWEQHADQRPTLRSVVEELERIVQEEKEKNECGSA